MAVARSKLGPTGKMTAKKIRAPKPPISWRVQQAVRWDRVLGLAGNKIAQGVTAVFGIPTLTSELRAVLIREDGSMVNFGVVSRRLVTTAFVTFMIDNLVVETAEWGDFKFHDSGVGVTAAAVGNTDIETTDGETRVTGSQVDADPIYRSVGTITYTTTKAITEHGLFSIVTGGTLMDRHVFTAINVDNTDSIQFTYELTVNDGG